jgi:hypothetical protein
MILTQTLQIPIFATIVPSDHTELSRLLAAAVVNTQFKTLLLDNPEFALENGYLGESFQLTEEERALLVSIRAGTLPDLAKQLTGALVSNRVLIG